MSSKTGIAIFLQLIGTELGLRQDGRPYCRSDIEKQMVDCLSSEFKFKFILKLFLRGSAKALVAPNIVNASGKRPAHFHGLPSNPSVYQKQGRLKLQEIISAEVICLR